MNRNALKEQLKEQVKRYMKEGDRIEYTDHEGNFSADVITQAGKAFYCYKPEYEEWVCDGFMPWGVEEETE